MVLMVAILAIGTGDRSGIELFPEIRQPAIRSVGAVEEEGTIRYQIFVTGGERATAGATITSVLPAHTALLGLEKLPPGVILNGFEQRELTGAWSEIGSRAGGRPARRPSTIGVLNPPVVGGPAMVLDDSLVVLLVRLIDRIPTPPPAPPRPAAVPRSTRSGCSSRRW